MFKSTSDGSNTALIQSEIDHARRSKAAAQECLPLSLKVTGPPNLTKVGTSLSSEFIIVAPDGTVTVDAQISDELLALGTVAMTGGDAGANDRQRTVSAAASLPPVTVTATYTPTKPGEVFTASVTIRVVNFALTVTGATATGGTTFVALKGPGIVTVVAGITPPPLCVTSDLVVWTNGVAAVDPLSRTVSRATVGSTTVSAKMAGVTRSVTIQVVQAAIDMTASTAVGAPALTFTQFGLWDNAFRADGTVFTDAVEANHFAGADSRKFHIRVKDPSSTGKGSITVDWRTLDQAGANLDAPANQTIALTETPAGSGSFVSKGLLLVTDSSDQNQPTPEAFGAANHRVRRGSMLGTAVAEYKPAGADPAKVSLPVFRRAPESRKKLPLQLFVLRVAAGGAGVVPTAAGSTVFARDLRVLRETYERLGIQVETVVSPGTLAANIAKDGADSLVLIDPPPGVNPANVTLADEANIAGIHKAIADTIRVFYTGGLKTGNRGEAAPDIDFAGKPDVGTAFEDGPALRQFSIAHEVGHILTDKPFSKNQGHYSQPAAPAGNRLFANQNVMQAGATSPEGVSATKRLWNTPDGDGLNQVAAILKPSHYLRSI